MAPKPKEISPPYGKSDVFLFSLLTNSPQSGIIVRQQGKPPGESSAGVAELADARDLKSRDTRVSYRFEPGVRHFLV